jgi:alpha-D-ribose 1-methylphosphonate 5-triphosphate synthase subunit PhnI
METGNNRKDLLGIAKSKMSRYDYNEFVAEVANDAFLSLPYDDYVEIDDLVNHLKRNTKLDSKGALELIMMISDYVRPTD